MLSAKNIVASILITFFYPMIMLSGNYNSMITLSLSDLIGVQKLMTAYGLASLCMVVTNLLIPSASGRNDVIMFSYSNKHLSARQNNGFNVVM